LPIYFVTKAVKIIKIIWHGHTDSLKNIIFAPLKQSTKIASFKTFCPGGEIGRHASLRGWCPHGRASSSLVLGTFFHRGLLAINGSFIILSARMAELVDALVSGTSIRKDVQVRVLFRAL
jgi:hypothetical protein